MPTYCFVSKDQRVVEQITCPHSELEERAPGGVLELADGTKLKRSIGFEHRGYVDKPGAWPMKSEAAGCHPTQIEEFRKLTASRGVPVDYTPDGRAIFTSRAHRRDACQALGLFDRSAGYGDAQRRHG